MILVNLTTQSLTSLVCLYCDGVFVVCFSSSLFLSACLKFSQAGVFFCKCLACSARTENLG